MKKHNIVLENVKKCVVETIGRYVSLEECVIFLFGSQADNGADHTSDIDIGIIAGEEISDTVLALIRDAVEEKAKTLRKIDIVDFLKVRDHIFCKEALRRIKLWHETKKSIKYLSNFKERIAG